MPQILSPLLSTVAMVSAFAALLVSWLAFRELRANTERSTEPIGHTFFLPVAGIEWGALSLVIILSGSPELTLPRCERHRARALSGPSLRHQLMQSQIHTFRRESAGILTCKAPTVSGFGIRGRLDGSPQSDDAGRG